MNNPEHDDKNPTGPFRLLITGVVLLAMLIAVGGLTWLWATREDEFEAPQRPTVAESLEPTLDLHVPAIEPHVVESPSGPYVGDRACVSCHREIGESYQGHSMGRSLATIAEAPEHQGEPGFVFEMEGIEYSVEPRDGKVFHREAVRNASGEVVAEIEEEVKYAIGSAERGISYLIERGEGFLFQSPISWYSQEGRWDLAPGYKGDNLHFERPILPECLFCHANRVAHVAPLANQYQEPIFLNNHAIGCERCHGPGQGHVVGDGLTEDDEGNPLILNPARLEPPLREAVCQQCHLMGEIRVDRPERRMTEFQPGEPLDAFMRVFVRPGSIHNRAVGHTEQMHESLCYQRSGGQMGCTSCHDPHGLPRPSEKIAFYRQRCLDCHQDQGCALDHEPRLAQSPEDSCIQCHMPQRSISDIAHTASTLHHIPRIVTEAELELDQPVAGAGFVEPLAGSTLLVPFPPDQGDSESAPSAIDRDLGVALSLKARDLGNSSLARQMARQALPRLESALEAQPDDAPAWEAKATALFVLDQPREALKALLEALRREPNEESLGMASMLASQADHKDEALDFVERLVELNPWRSQHHLNLARLHAQAERWADAVEACRAALRLDPMSYPARRLLLASLLQLDRDEEAQIEFDALLEFDVPGQGSSRF